LRGIAPRRLTLTLSLIVGGVITFAFAWFVRSQSTFVLLALYVWTGLLASVVVVEFWLLVAEVLDFGQAKRIFAVIGAGVMGSGIAAHLANAGIEVLLIDIVPPNLKDDEAKQRAARDRFAASGLDKAIKARPAAFFQKDRARLVSIGNVADDLEKLRSVDLVVEAIIEQLEPKRALFEKLEAVISSDCVVASNTSGLRIADMMKGRSESFRRRFLVMHFFNPVRYMKLLELVAGPDTAPETLDHVRRFGEDALGKGVVFGKDTPNFIGNRIGVHAMLTGIHLMLEDGLAPEDVDAITGEPLGHPKSASFRTADLVGVDTLVHVAANCYAALVSDEERKVFEVPSFIGAMVEKKLLGDKTKGGFYKKGKEGVDTLDPKTLEYRPRGGDKEIRAKVKELAQIEDVRIQEKPRVWLDRQSIQVRDAQHKRPRPVRQSARAASQCGAGLEESPVNGSGDGLAQYRAERAAHYIGALARGEAHRVQRPEVEAEAVEFECLHDIGKRPVRRRAWIARLLYNGRAFESCFPLR